MNQKVTRNKRLVEKSIVDGPTGGRIAGERMEREDKLRGGSIMWMEIRGGERGGCSGD